MLDIMHSVDLQSPISPKIHYVGKAKSRICGLIQEIDVVSCQNCGSYDLEDITIKGELRPKDILIE